MLVVHSSNRLEALLQQLLQTMNNVYVDPFLPETIVVQNQGMARWVSQQIAIQRGVCANIDTPSPGILMWRLPGYWIEDWPDHQPVSKETLVWQVYALLPELLPIEAFAELRQYLEQDASGSGQFQLCQRIANTFDQYLIYRPELIRLWEAGEESHWQAILWRRLMEVLQTGQSKHTALHWGKVCEQFATALKQGQPIKQLPSRISIFGVASMPPIYIELLNAAAAHIDISIYYVNPCREYWADIVDERGQSKRRAKAKQAGKDDPTGLLDIGSPLLASWGLAGQAFLDQLLENGIEEFEHFQSPTQQTLLAQVQSDILELEDRSQSDATQVSIDADDTSIQIHSSHSRLREVQILHDQLLQLFQTLPGLEPRDIIVMAPDIDQYAPFIDATFAAVDGAMRIPWSIADRRVRSEQRLLDTFRQFVELPDSRFEAADVLSLLEVPAVSRRFSLDNNGLQYLRNWVTESGIRWSLDADMKTDHDLPAEAANTWDFGLQRLFVGYAMPHATAEADGQLYEGISPYSNIEGTSALYLSALQQFISQCSEWRRELDKERSITEWIETLERLLEAFLAPEDDEIYALQSLRSALHDMADNARAVDLQRNIGRPVVLEILHHLLEDNSNSRQFITGQVTFSNMVPMRSIPFRVVCLIGMNAGSFPRDHRADSFDLLMKKPKRGDRTRRTDDRYLFLETLLSARDIFYLSYIGNDVRDDSLKAPSIVLTELRDYINKSYIRAGGVLTDMAFENTATNEQPSANLESSASQPTASRHSELALPEIRHPLQPFSKRYFDASNPLLVNYKSHWFDAANAVVSDAENLFFDKPIVDRPDADDNTVDLFQLIKFYQDPAKQFLIEGLQIQLLRDEVPLENDEPFSLDSLQQWQVKQKISSNLQSGADHDEIVAALRAQGVLPVGAYGEQLVSGALTSVGQFLHRLAHRQTHQLPAQEIDLRCGQFSLVGQLEGLQSSGDDAGSADAGDGLSIADLVLFRLGKIRGSDLLEGWIKHLVKCQHRASACATVLVCENETWVFQPVENALQLLTRLLELRHAGLTQPLHLFPATSFAYARTIVSDGIGSIYDKEVKNAWEGAKNFNGTAQFGEAHREPVSLVWRGREPIRDESFKLVAEEVFGPLLINSSALAAEEDLS